MLVFLQASSTLDTRMLLKCLVLKEERKKVCASTEDFAIVIKMTRVTRGKEKISAKVLKISLFSLSSVIAMTRTVCFSAFCA